MLDCYFNKLAVSCWYTEASRVLFAFCQDPLAPQSQFATRTIGTAGGRLHLYGVSLEIPPGALLVEKSIRLGIIWEISHKPKLNENKAMLCPVVSCEPHGLHFQKPVKLTMPHCATADGVKTVSKAWRFILLKSETELRDPVTWVRARRPRDYIYQKVTRARIRIHINHFTLFNPIGKAINTARAVVGIPATKVVKLVAHAPPFTATGFYRITITCIDDYQEKVRRAVFLNYHLASSIYICLPCCFLSFSL